MNHKCCVLLTRSVEENIVAANWLSQKAIDILTAPMIEYTRLDCNFSSFEDVNEIIITSKFGAKLVSEHYLFDVDAWVVGEESARIISINPKIKVRYVASSVMDLIDNYVHTGNHSSRIIYFSGSAITQEVPFATRQVLYKSRYTDIIPDEVISAIHDRNVDVIMLYSKNCAINLLRLLTDYGLVDVLANIIVVAISEEVGKVMSSHVKEVLVPEHHNSEEMLKLVEYYAKGN